MPDANFAGTPGPTPCAPGTIQVSTLRRTPDSEPCPSPAPQTGCCFTGCRGILASMWSQSPAALLDRAARSCQCPESTPCPMQAGCQEFPSLSELCCCHCSKGSFLPKYGGGRGFLCAWPRLAREQTSVGLVAFLRFILYSQRTQESKNK